VGGLRSAATDLLFAGVPRIRFPRVRRPPAVTAIDFDPWTGTPLPPSVRDAYFEEAEKLLGQEVGVLDDALDTLPQAFRGEAWWIERGLWP
jgi:hypothetical protein